MSTDPFDPFNRASQKFPELATHADLAEMSRKSQALWEREGVHNYDPDSGKEVFSIDTPPPYVSADHLHVGHAMSYTQAEILVRYQRMQGKEIFYPMGFDDNGLPTERHVEKKNNITDKSQMSRSDFRALCVAETQAGAKTYEEIWRSLGISVDWNLRFSTIDERSQRASQLSFLDLHKKDLIYRAEEPVLWDTKFQTALAQADLETIERKGKLYDLEFQTEEGSPLMISTSRPEMISGCVGLFYHPDDERYKGLDKQKAVIPMSGHNVPLIPSDTVDAGFGTGLMMCCTFGDAEDIAKWKAHDLDTRTCVGADGKMTALAGVLEGLPVIEARSKIVKILKEQGVIKGEQNIKQAVSVGERSEEPVEFNMAPQWFINVLDHTDKFRQRADELEWYPEHMKTRLVQWIDGLKYDWNVSRQRYYGVPFPVWYVENENGQIIDTIVADEQDLPVDPMEDEPPQWAKDKHPNMTFRPETDVMDTWMTSSVSPQINANWTSLDQDMSESGIFPMDLRVQAHEIVRTWLFYTMIKSEFHANSLPWKDVMISGWGVNEQGKKISKRSLEKETDADGFNRFNPEHLIEKYGADAVRYWASGAKLGQDLKFSEKEIRRGGSATNKLWNASRLAFIYMDDFNPQTDKVPFDQRTLEDQWITDELNETIQKVSSSLDEFDYASARTALDKFFFSTYCDNYLEIIKHRFQDGSSWNAQEIKSTQTTLFETTQTLLGLYAPYMPFVTEELYQQGNKFGQPNASLHQTQWPSHDANLTFDRKNEMQMVMGALSETRKLRSEQKIKQGATLDSIELQYEDPADVAMAQRLNKSLTTALRAQEVIVQQGSGITIATQPRPIPQ